MPNFDALYLTDGTTSVPLSVLLTAITDIHYPRRTLSEVEVCTGCEEPSGGEFEVEYPCPTIEAVEQTLKEVLKQCSKSRRVT